MRKGGLGQKHPEKKAAKERESQERDKTELARLQRQEQRRQSLEGKEDQKGRTPY